MVETISRFRSVAEWNEFERQIGLANPANIPTAKLIREIFDPSKAIPDSLRKAFQQADQTFLLSGVLDKSNLQDVFSGACLLMSFIVENWVFVANAGDSKAVFGKQFPDQHGEMQWRAMPLSTIHTAQTEEELVMRSHPGEPDAVTGGRIKGYLEPSRGLGDALFKDKYFNKCLLPEAQLPEPFTPPYTTANPDVEMLQIDSKQEKDSFLILASDGLWDMVSDQQAIQCVAQAMRNNENASLALLKKSLEMTSFEGETLSEKMASSLKLPAKLRRQYYDDTSIIVIFFRPSELPANVLPAIPQHSSTPPTSFVKINEKLQGYLPPQSTSPL